MDPDVVQIINAVANKALADPLIVSRFAELGVLPWQISPSDLTAFRDREEERLMPIVSAASLKAN
jgi:tripartite-type tricarboxylate transporter receptor subunit TctC